MKETNFEGKIKVSVIELWDNGSLVSTRESWVFPELMRGSHLYAKNTKESTTVYTTDDLSFDDMRMVALRRRLEWLQNRCIKLETKILKLNNSKEKLQAEIAKSVGKET